MVRTTSAILAIASIGLVSAAPVQRREVPQEHSHEFSLRICNKFLKLNNPDGIVDCVFGLLGNAAAQTGIGNFAGGPDCLQTGSADRAFTNAKAAGDIEGMTHTLIYRAVERNTGKVGLESVLCTQFTPVNPEVAALSQHQDPASPNAAATNKAITLELARQIASFGGDPLDALQSGTFAPGDVNDPTAAGNTCDDPNDAAGCIISRGLLVEDATPEEIAAAVSGVTPPAGGGQGAGGADGGQGAGAGSDQGTDAPADCPPPATSTVTVTATAAPTATDDAGVCTVPTTTTVTVTANAGGATPAPSSAAGGGGNASSTTAANPPAQTGALSFGTCKNPTIEFGRGLPGRGPNELAFQPADQVNFQHGAALGLGVIMDSNCNNLVNRCGVKNTDPAFQACQAAKAQVLALGKNNGAAADKFNELLGFTTDFARLDAGNAKRRRAFRRHL